MELFFGREMFPFIIVFIILIVVIAFLYIIKPNVDDKPSHREIQCINCRSLDPEQLALGRKIMLKHKVVICGISRDNADQLPIEEIEETGKLFEDYRVIVFENDSTDGTKDLLNQWKNKNNHVTILSKDYHCEKRPNIAFLAKCRNKYLKELQKHTYHDFDILLVVDMDMKYGWDINGLFDSFSKIDQWDAVGSNGVYTKDGKMWDMFAFRNEEFPETPHNPHYWTEIVPAGQKHYCVGTQLIPVDSCFGGLAVYKRRFINGCKYQSPDGDCEHISFHRHFKNNGGRIFMNPSQVTFYSHLK